MITTTVLYLLFDEGCDRFCKIVTEIRLDLANTACVETGKNVL